MSIKIGSRKSHLAVVQAKKVQKAIVSADSNVETDLFLKSSFGDLNLDMDLSTTEEKGVFTKDLVESLKAGECDLVAHSWKDLPVEQIKETKITGTIEREDSRDLFFIKKDSVVKKDWTVLTSSPRREFNITSFFNFLTDDEKDIRFKAIRGNIPTRFLKYLEDPMERARMDGRGAWTRRMARIGSLRRIS